MKKLLSKFKELTFFQWLVLILLSLIFYKIGLIEEHTYWLEDYLNQIDGSVDAVRESIEELRY